MRRLILLLLLASLPVFAVDAKDILDQASAELAQAPWKARLLGTIVGPGGNPQKANFTVKALPAEGIVRIDFRKPDSLADNYVVITPEKVYNYLFLTNQVIVYPRTKARIEGLGFDLSRIGDLRDLGQENDISWEKPETTSLEGQPAWHLSGRALDPTSAGFARIEVWIGKKPTRLLKTTFYTETGEMLSDLKWRDFARLKLTKDDLLKFPLDAEWIKKR